MGEERLTRVLGVLVLTIFTLGSPLKITSHWRGRSCGRLLGKDEGPAESQTRDSAMKSCTVPVTPPTEAGHTGSFVSQGIHKLTVHAGLEEHILMGYLGLSISESIVEVLSKAMLSRTPKVLISQMYTKFGWCLVQLYTL